MVNRKESLKLKAQYLSSDISKKFVPKPSWRRILSDKIRGIRLLVNNLWQKEYSRIKHMKSKQKLLDSTVVSESTTDDNDSISILNLIDDNSQYYNYSKEEQEYILIEDTIYNDATSCLGLGTSFRSSQIKLAPKGIADLEYFLNNLARELLRRAFSQKKGDKEIHLKFPLYEDVSQFISELIRDCKDLEYIMVSTNKINGYIMMERDKYIMEIKDAFAKVSNIISIKNVKKIKDKALEILEKFRCEMSQKEYDGIN